mgnify:CR=1 FL=1
MAIGRLVFSKIIEYTDSRGEVGNYISASYSEKNAFSNTEIGAGYRVAST